MNLHSTFELEDFVIVAVARIELDDDFVVFGLPAGAKVVIFLKHCGRHRQLNDHRLMNSTVEYGCSQDHMLA
jgi:hypothetical protein